MKLGILGTRGIPSAYGGFETFAEELSKRLVRRGHEVTVFGRRGMTDPSRSVPDGVRVVNVPGLRGKHLDTATHGFAQCLAACREPWDSLLVCNLIHAPLALRLRKQGIPLVIAVDGLESQRKKWGFVGRQAYQLCEKLVLRERIPLVTDAAVISEYWRGLGHTDFTEIAYGVNEAPAANPERVRALGLEPGRYVLYVSRLEPENNARVVIRAFEGLHAPEMTLAIVGDSPYAEGYKAMLRETRDERIRFLGGIYGKDYPQLHRHAFCYVQATEVGGTHPALLEGLAWSPCVLANDTPENREVVADAGILYARNHVADLRARLQALVDHPEQRRDIRKRAKERIYRHYTWSKVTDAYEALFERLAKTGNR